MTTTSKLSRLLKFFWLNDDRHPFMKEWDELLQLLIKYGKITKLDNYTVTFDDKYTVWISNHPYASGHLYKLNGTSVENQFNCSKNTRILLEDFINSKHSDEPIIQDIVKDSLAIKANIFTSV